MRKLIINIKDWSDDKLRYLCGLMSPENRLIFILIVLLIFSLINVYITFHTIRNWNRGIDRTPDVEHIERFRLPEPTLSDSIVDNAIKNLKNEYD